MFTASANFKPFVDWAGSRRNVKCPDCMAEVGAPCTSPGGSVRKVVHLVRKRMSQRAYNQERG